MKKADLVAKIAAEQKLDPKVLERMTVVELQKMDVVVPDDGDLLGEPAKPDIHEAGAIETPDATLELPTDLTTAPGAQSGASDVPETSGTDEVKGSTLVGYNPVTGKEIYL